MNFQISTPKVASFGIGLAIILVMGATTGMFDYDQNVLARGGVLAIGTDEQTMSVLVHMTHKQEVCR